MPRYRALPLCVDARPSHHREVGQAVPSQQVSEVLERLTEKIVTAAHFEPAKKKVIPMERARVR